LTWYFHSWKFEPLFLSDGISYRRLEACEVLLEDVELDDMEGMLMDEGVAAGGAADTEGVFDIYIYDSVVGLVLDLGVLSSRAHNLFVRVYDG
jgi:hypothetical protein